MNCQEQLLELQPAGIRPDGYLGLAIEHPGEFGREVGVTVQLLDRFQVGPDIDGEEFIPVLNV